jgi:hypothetical protein
MEKTMKKIIFILTILIIFLSSCTRKNNTNQEKKIFPDEKRIDLIINDETTERLINKEQNSKIMYVNSPEGLRVRNSPGLDGDRIGLLENLVEVNILKEEQETVTIDGIIGKWTFIKINNIEGWVFGGYLINNPIFGLWECLPTGNEWDFNMDMSFGNNCGISAYRYHGTFELKEDNNILFHYDYIQDHEFWNSEMSFSENFIPRKPERIIFTVEGKIIFINNNRITIEYMNWEQSPLEIKRK